MKRSLTMLADDYDPLKYKPNGSYMSEKYDGIRALWLPFTRNLNFRAIPWANTLRDDRDYVCSGLWTRRGKVILAPQWFLDALPKDIPLDGELWIGRKMFQKTQSVVRKLEPVDSEWEDITYMIFDIPCLEQFFKTGQIREGGDPGKPAYGCYFKASWADQFPGIKESKYWPIRRFSDNQISLKLNSANWDDRRLRTVPQEVLPPTHALAEARLAEKFKESVEHGAEGLMMRRGHSIWEPLRSKDLVKFKPLKDDEATIIGYKYGEGKYLGMVGAFEVRWFPKYASAPKTFYISGFTDAEREIHARYEAEAIANPGAKTKDDISKCFSIGNSITFQYGGDFTEDGIPKIARYLRPRVE